MKKRHFFFVFRTIFVYIQLRFQGGMAVRAMKLNKDPPFWEQYIRNQQFTENANTIPVFHKPAKLNIFQ